MDIEFAFDNRKIMKQLTQRANLLKKGEFEKAEKVEDSMTKTKNEKFEQITTPLSFFYTFKSQKAFNALIKNPLVDLFPRKKTKIQRADHPSNIIFENLSVSRTWRFSC